MSFQWTPKVNGLEINRESAFAERSWEEEDSGKSFRTKLENCARQFESVIFLNSCTITKGFAARSSSGASLKRFSVTNSKPYTLN